MMILWGLHGRVLLHGYGCYIICRDIYSHIKKIFQHFFPSYIPMKCQHKAHWVDSGETRPIGLFLFLGLMVGYVVRNVVVEWGFSFLA